MLENLSERLQGIFSGLRSKGRLTEDDINAAMREIRLALLEADVNFRVVKDFVARCKEQCLTAEVLTSLTPAQNVVKVVLAELTELLGSTESKLTLMPNRTPNVIMLVGLQGSGKTTASAKLAYMLKRLACRSTAVTVRIPSRSRARPSRRPSTTSATWSSSTPPAVSRSTSS